MEILAVLSERDSSASAILIGRHLCSVCRLFHQRNLNVTLALASSSLYVNSASLESRCSLR